MYIYMYMLPYTCVYIQACVYVIIHIIIFSSFHEPYVFYFQIQENAYADV